jgi:hypothetical protein
MTTPALPPHPFTTAEARSLGITDSQLRHAVERGEIRRVIRGVYVPSDVPDDQRTRCAAAKLVLSPTSVARDRTAAWLLGIDVLEYDELVDVPPIETCVLRGTEPTRRTDCRGGTRDLAPEDIMVIDGIRVTTPLRTAMDLGCALRRASALAALDAFMREYGLTLAQMCAMLPRYFRRRGVIQLRSLVPLADPRSESSGESWTRLAILDAGLPRPRPQYWIVIDGVPVFRLDLAYPRHKVAVEYDGREFHLSEEQRERDRRRRQWLRDHGWTVIVVDKDSFTADALDAWLRELRVALGLA